MDTLKTGFIVLLLLAVLYGVYVVLNNEPPTPPTAEIAWHQQQAEQELQIDISTGDTAPAAIDGSAPAADSTALAVPPVGPADLSSTSASPAAVPMIPEPSTVPVDPPAWPPPLPSAAGPVDSTATATSPVPDAIPSASGSPVSAPTLLATEPTEVPQPMATPGTPPPSIPAAAPGTEVPLRPDGLSSLPALRDAPVAGPAENPADPVPTLPGVSSVAPAAPSVAPLVQDSSTAVAAPPLQPDAPTTTAESTPAVAPEANPGAKLVSTSVALESAMREVQSNIAAEQWYQALFVLSKFYGSSDLPDKQQQELVDLLDPLAAKVVYSPQHLVTDAYEVRRGDTLPQIGAMYQVPPELLANINGIENPNLLVPGTKLKVVRGPFRAEINLQKKELTLFVGQLYAGRFPVSIGQEPAPLAGEYRVVEKQPGRDYFPSSGPLLAANDPLNPFGRVWIGLDKQLAIHGSPERGDAGTAGCISLSPLDAGDVYSILTVGSSVVIRP